MQGFGSMLRDYLEFYKINYKKHLDFMCNKPHESLNAFCL